MKIDSPVTPLGGRPVGPGRDGTKPSAANTRPASGQGSEVALSPLSTRLQEIETTSSAGAVVDSDRVNALREAIAAGNFKIDTSRIADGLINSVRQMLSAQK